MKNTVKIKKASVNKALAAAAEYSRNIAAKTEGTYDEFNEAVEAMKPYLNKDGSVSKTKTRSKKAKAALNAAAAHVLEVGSSKRKRQRNKKNKQTAQAAKVLQDKFKGKGAKDKGSTAARIFFDKTWDKLKKNINSDVVITLSDAGFNVNQILDITKYLKREIVGRTPKELKKFVKEDEAALFVDHVANLHELYPQLTIEETVQIAQQMTDLKLNNYKGVVEEWGILK